MTYAKANPGKVRIGNSGTGAIWHLAAAALEDKTGAKFSHVPYDGAAPAITGLLGGHIEAVSVSPGEVINHVKGGKLKTLEWNSRVPMMVKYSDSMVTITP
ncbi:tripartite tricarboxylate transporter substrate-binding protein, partial [Pseudomonas aeruginosa]|uniref:tripartite tricarboxylate transporter substrate-binding protein n=1 Tax=Pseudomonas aeruginosa TaxID=287 RepID=UPI0031B711BE